MKSNILSATCLAVLIGTSASYAVGQQPTPPPANQPIPSESIPTTTGGWPTPEEAVTRMSSKLNLTDDQKAKITPIIADRQTQMRALMADTSGRRMQKARKAKSIMSDSDKKIEAILTSDQKKTYAEMKEQMKEQLQARRQQNAGSNMQ
jgi:Spy/CpxP family protein refolding chaperone